MKDFEKILNKAKELEASMKEKQEQIKKIEPEGISGGNKIKIILNGDGDIKKLEISDDLLKENKNILDIGCNSGYLTSFYAKVFSNSNFVGFDKSRNSILQAFKIINFKQYNNLVLSHDYNILTKKPLPIYCVKSMSECSLPGFTQEIINVDIPSSIANLTKLFFG